MILYVRYSYTHLLANIKFCGFVFFYSYFEVRLLTVICVLFHNVNRTLAKVLQIVSETAIDCTGYKAATRF